MKITLYKNSADMRLVNKSPYLTELQTYNNISLKDDCSILNPTIVLRQSNIDFTSNYAYIEDFERYYSILDINVINNSMIELTLVCDVLYTYKDTILNSTQLIGRQENERSEYQADGLIPADVDNDVTIYEFTQGSFNTDTATNTTRNFVLTVAGRN